MTNFPPKPHWIWWLSIELGRVRCFTCFHAHRDPMGRARSLLLAPMRGPQRRSRKCRAGTAPRLGALGCRCGAAGTALASDLSLVPGQGSGSPSSVSREESRPQPGRNGTAGPAPGAGLPGIAVLVVLAVSATLIRGLSLRRWLEGARRTWGQVLEMAGKGPDGADIPVSRPRGCHCRLEQSRCFRAVPAEGSAAARNPKAGWPRADPTSAVALSACVCARRAQGSPPLPHAMVRAAAGGHCSWCGAAPHPFRGEPASRPQSCGPSPCSGPTAAWVCPLPCDDRSPRLWCRVRRAAAAWRG